MFSREDRRCVFSISESEGSRVGRQTLMGVAKEKDNGVQLDENGRPCRSCTSFKSWMKNMNKTESTPFPLRPTSEANSSSTTASTVASYGADHPQRSDCPVNKDELGRNTWSFLHTMAATYPEKPSVEQQADMRSFVYLFSKFYPCWYCAKDLQEDLKTDIPDTSSQSAFAQWMCRIHNTVNKKLAKPLFDCKKVDERWKTGWKDGSCDV